MLDLQFLIDAVEENIKDVEEVIANDPGPLTEPKLSNAISKLSETDTSATEALEDPSLVDLHPTMLGTPWPSGANNKVDLAVQWAVEAQTVGTDQEKADRLGSVKKIITWIMTDIGA